MPSSPRAGAVVMLGDLNTTEREPAYSELSAGLRDSHLDAGLGPGLTWGPDRFGFLPFGLLRIDYILVSPQIPAADLDRRLRPAQRSLPRRRDVRLLGLVEAPREDHRGVPAEIGRLQS